MICANPSGRRRTGGPFSDPVRGVLLPLLLLLGTAGVGALSAPAAQALMIDFNGAFGQDDDVQLFNFSVFNNATVTLQTTGNAGGGFDPILTLFDSAGKLIDENDTAPAGTGEDSLLSVALTPGFYLLALTQFDNFAVSTDLADGFVRDGEGDYTGVDFGPGSGQFYDLFGDQRTGAWAVTFDNVDRAAIGTVPVPPSLSLLLLGLAVLAARRARSAA